MARFSGFERILRTGQPLSQYTWFRLGGPAEFFATPANLDDLRGLVERCRLEGIPARLLGAGSNVLVRDEGVTGLVIHLGAPEFCKIERKGRTLRVGAGARLSHVISAGVREGLSGLEELVGIPGTIGGALHGNSGASGGDIGQWTSSATVLTREGELKTRSRGELHFAHRHSSLDELAVVEAEFELEQGDSAELTQRMQKLWIVKQAQHPQSGLPTGAIFKDPGGMSAAQLIEESGCKGAREGATEVSEVNANFFVTHPGAKATEVLALADRVKAAVADRLGVELELQIQVW